MIGWRAERNWKTKTSQTNGVNVEKKATEEKFGAVGSNGNRRTRNAPIAREALEALAQSDKDRAENMRLETESIIFETSSALISSRARVVSSLRFAWLQSRLAAISADVLGDRIGAQNFNDDSARIADTLSQVEKH